MKRKLISVLLTVGLLASVASPVSANSDCDPGRADDFVSIRYGGWREDATGTHYINAVGASLEYLTPHVEWGQLFASTSVWVGLGDTFSPAYVQAGYLAQGLVGTDRKIFIQWRSPAAPAPTEITFAPPINDTTHDFQIARQANGSFKVFYDSSLLYTVSLSQAGGFYPKKAEIMSENQTKANQFWGGTWDYEDIDLMRYGIDGGNYIDYGESAYTTEIDVDDNGYGTFAAVWRYPNQEPWPSMDVFDWACH